MPKQKSEVTMHKSYEGNDRYSWAVFVNGRLKWDGMSKSEAAWRRDCERRRLGEIK